MYYCGGRLRVRRERVDSYKVHLLLLLLLLLLLHLRLISSSVSVSVSPETTALHPLLPVWRGSRMQKKGGGMREVRG